MKKTILKKNTNNNQKNNQNKKSKRNTNEKNDFNDIFQLDQMWKKNRFDWIIIKYEKLKIL